MGFTRVEGANYPKSYCTEEKLAGPRYDMSTGTS